MAAAVVEPERVTVLVVDDHPLYRDGLVRALSQRVEFEVVGECADAETALEQLRAQRPDVALIDVRLAGGSGIDVVRESETECLGTRVVLISASLDHQLVHRAMSSGAWGYVSKDADREEICDAVLAVARGERRVAGEAQRGLLDALQQGETPSELTARECEVLALTAQGLGAPEVGRRLYVSRTTVKSHLQNIYAKLGVSDRAGAVAEALRRGLID